AQGARARAGDPEGPLPRPRRPHRGRPGARRPAVRRGGPGGAGRGAQRRVPDDREHRTALRAGGLPRARTRAGRPPARPDDLRLRPGASARDSAVRRSSRPGGPAKIEWPQTHTQERRSPRPYGRNMTVTDDSPRVGGRPHNPAQTTITVDDPQVMVNLLGAKDEILKLVEQSVASDVLVRGNEITITGSAADNALTERIFAEL